MRIITLILLLLLYVGSIELKAQEEYDQDKQSAYNVFELFFKSMHNRDTVTLKRITHPFGWYFMSWRARGESMIITGGGYIIATDHSIHDGISTENALTFIAAVKEHGHYPIS